MLSLILGSFVPRLPIVPQYFKDYIPTVSSTLNNYGVGQLIKLTYAF